MKKFLTNISFSAPSCFKAAASVLKSLPSLYIEFILTQLLDLLLNVLYIQLKTENNIKKIIINDMITTLFSEPIT